MWKLAEHNRPIAIANKSTYIVLTNLIDAKKTTQMKYNTLGTTGMKVSHVSLGGASFSNIYGIQDEGKSLQLIRECLQLGVNYLETSPWYGQGSSERTIGKVAYYGSREVWHDPCMMFQALQGIPRDAYFIGSKVGRYEMAVAHMFDFSAEKTEVAVDNTLKLLDLEYVDVIQIHDPTFAPDMSVLLKETLPTLERAVKDGKARFVGLADYDVDLMKEIIEESDIKISTVLSYAKSTLIDNRLQNYTKYFKSKGVGIINAAATGMGLLTNNGPQPWHPASDDIKAICKQASDYCKERGVELARLASWFTLNQPNVDTNMCGFFNSEQMKDTLSLLDTGLTEHEKSVMMDLKARFFENVAFHWDGVELPAYKLNLKNCRK